MTKTTTKISQPNLTPPCSVCGAIAKGHHLTGDLIQRGTEESLKEVAVSRKYDLVGSDLDSKYVDDNVAELLLLAEIHQGRC